MQKLKNVFWLWLVAFLWIGAAASNAQVTGVTTASTLCLGSTASIAVSGTFNPGNQFSVYLVDGGNGTIYQHLGTGSSSPIVVSIPATAPFAPTAPHGYYIRVTTTSPGTGTGGTINIGNNPVGGVPNDFGPVALQAAPTGTITIGQSVPTAPLNQVCSGSTLTLTANLQSITAATYAWYKDGVAIPSATGTFASIAAGGYIATYTVASAVAGTAGSYVLKAFSSAGCELASAPYAVAVNAAPGIPVLSASAITLCQYSSGTLSATSSSTATPLTYNWCIQGSPTTILATGSSVAMTTATAGTFNYIVKVTDANNCSVMSVNPLQITVNPMPTAPTARANDKLAGYVTGTAGLCEGSTIMLSASGSTVSSGSVSYNWAGPAGFTAAGSTASIPNSATTMSGIYTVSAVGSMGMCATTATVSVNVVAAPPVVNFVNGSSSVCYGVGVNIATTPSYTSGYTYQWAEELALNTNVPAPSGTASNFNTTDAGLNATPFGLGGSSTGGLAFDAATGGSKTYIFRLTMTETASGYSCTRKTVNGYQVTVKPGPGTVTSAGPVAPLCSGTTVTLTANTSAGATPPAGTLFTWQGPTGYVAVNSAAPTVSLSPASSSQSGVYTVSAVNGTCSAQSTVSITVYTQPTASASAPNTPICTGQTLQLNSSGGTGVPVTSYTWSQSTGGGLVSTNVQNPTATGMTDPSATAQGTGYSYSVTINNNGCTSTATTSALVIQQPTAIAVTGQGGAVCAGTNSNLNALTSTGIGTGTGYSWAGPGFTAATSQPTISASSTTANDGVYSLTVTNQSCISTATTSLKVFMVPTATAAITPSGTVCAGLPVSWSSNGGAITGPSQAITYAWDGSWGSVPGGFNVTSATPALATGLSGTPGGNPYNFTVTIRNGAAGNGTPCQSTATTNITVFSYALANASATNTVVCTGTSLVLDASSTTNTAGGVTTYSWAHSGGFSGSTTANMLTVSTAATTAMDGVYSLTAANNTSCSSTATVSVKVYTKPTATATATPTPLCTNQPISLGSNPGSIAGPSQSVTYAWTGLGAFNATLQNPAISAGLIGTPAGNGYVYSVVIQNGSAAGCTSSATTSVLVYTTPTAVATNDHSGMICAGQALRLDAQFTTGTVGGGTMYSWSGPNAFASGAYQPSISAATTAADGVYTLTASNFTCTSTATTSVKVFSIPTASASINPAGPVCSGTALNFSSNNGGLTGPSQDPSYAWQGSWGTVPSSFSVTSQNPMLAAGAIIGTPGGNDYFFTVTTYNGASGNPAGACRSTATTSIRVFTTPNAVATNGNDGRICAGQTITLDAQFSTQTDGVITKYSWNGPNSFTSTAYQPNIASATTAADGVYTLVAANGSCSTSATTSVKVYSIPTAAAGITPSGPVCAGTALNFSSNNGGLTGPSQMPAYAWEGSWGAGPSGFSTTAQNPMVAAGLITGTPAGNDYFFTVTTYNGSSGNPAGRCQSTATTSIRVFTTPTAIAQNGNAGRICAGQTILLDAQNTTSTNGAVTTYNWTGPNGYASSAYQPSVTGATTAADGVYTLVAANNTCTSSATTSVKVYSIPTAAAGITPSGPVCSGTALNFTSNNGGLTGPSQLPSYAWQASWGAGPSGFSATAQNPMVAAGLITGTPGGNDYFFTVTTYNGSSGNPAGACQSTASTSIKVFTTPTAIAKNGVGGRVCAGTRISLDANSTTGTDGIITQYAWAGPNSFTSTLTQPSTATATTAMDGVYSLTASNGTCTSSATTSVAVYMIPAPTAQIIPAALCDGAPIALSSQANVSGPSQVLTYSWSGFGTFNATQQNPAISAGLIGIPSGNPYTFSVSISNGSDGATGNPCIASTTASVVVYSNVGANLTGTTANVCSGTTLSLNALNSVGNSSASTYVYAGPNGYSLTSSSATPTVSTAATTDMDGVYSVTISNNGFCSSSATVRVRVYMRPTASSSLFPTPLCSGQTINLFSNPGNVTGVSNAVTYQWTGGGTFNTTLQNPVITAGLIGTPAGNGYIYSVTIQNGFSGCVSAATTSVNVFSTPTAVATTNSPVCSGGTLSLNAINTTGTVGSGTAYSWAGPNGYTNTSTAYPVTVSTAATTAMDGVYTLTASNNSCASTATTSVSVFTRPTASITAGQSGPICQGQTVNFTANTGTIAGPSQSIGFTWAGGVAPYTYSSTSQMPAIASLAGTDAGNSYFYTVTVNNNSCTSTASTMVTVFTSPAANLASTMPSQCTGSPLALNALSSNNIAGGATVFMFTGPNGFSYTGASATPTISSPTTDADGVYQVTISNGTCTSSASTSVKVFTKPTATASMSPNPVCDGSPISLSSNPGTITGVSQSISYQWSGFGSFDATAQNPTVTTLIGTVAGNNYVFSVTVGNGPASCTVSTTTSIKVHLTPKVVASNGVGGQVCAGQTITLDAVNSSTDVIAGTTRFSWAGPNGFTSTLGQPSVTSATTAADGVYTVTATNGSCTASSTTSIRVFSIPTAAASITPAGPVCSGAALNFSSSNGGLVGASQTPTYRWEGSWVGTPSGFSTTVQNPTLAAGLITGTANGNPYLFTVTTYNGSCQSTATTSIKVFSSPTAIARTGVAGQVCSGTAITLDAVPSSASYGTDATYAWAGPNGFTSTLSQPSTATATTAMDGVYSLTVANGTCSSSATTSVAVFMKPTASITPTSPLNVCDGAPFTLSASNNGISGSSLSPSYSWGGFGTFNATAQNPTVTSGLIGTAGGNQYVFSVTAGNGGVAGCSSSATISVVAYSSPTLTAIASSTNLCAGTSLGLTVTGSTGTATWAGPNGFTATGSTTSVPSTTTANSGVYTVSVAAAGGCLPTTTVNVTVCTAPVVTLTATNAPVTLGNPIALRATITGAGATCVNSIVFTGPDAYSVTYYSDGSASALAVNPAPAGSAVGTFNSVAIPNATSRINSGGVFTPIRSATGSIYYVQVVGTCGIQTASVDVSVAPTTPTVTVSGTPSPATAGGNVGLSATSTPAATAYMWAGPCGFSSTLQSPTVTSIATSCAGTYSVTVTTTAGTASGTVVINVNAAPVVVAPVTPTANLSIIKDILYRTVMSGDVVYITVAVINNGPDAATNVQVKDVLPAGMTYQTGPYAQIGTISHSAGTVTGTIPSIASGEIKLIRFNVRVTGTVGQVIVNSAEISASSANDPNSTPNNGVVTEDDYDDIDVRIVAVPSSRISASESVVGGVSVKTYPNPTVDRVTVEISGEEAAPAYLQLTDVNGRTVAEWSLSEETTTHKAEINVSKYNQGVYFLRSEMNGKVVTKKIIKAEL